MDSLHGAVREQCGFALVSAIFLVVVIALIAGFMVSIGGVARTTSALSAVSTRADFAARSGIEWGVYEVLANPAAPACFTSPSSFTLAGGGAMAFTVTVSCRATAVSEGPDSYTVFDLDAVAEFGARGAEDYFRRTLSAAVSSSL